MSTQMPLLGTSTPNGYQPATGAGAVRDIGAGANTGAQGGMGTPTGTTEATASGTGSSGSPASSSGAAGGSSPGAGASIAAPDTSALGQDPAYLAYVRALGVKDTTESANIQSQIDALNRGVQLRLPQMQSAADVANRGLLGKMESRGILNSGETENNLSTQQARQQAAMSAIQDQAAQRTAALINQLAQFRAGQGVSLAEQGLRAGQTVANTDGTNQINTDVANAAAGLGI